GATRGRRGAGSVGARGRLSDMSARAGGDDEWAIVARLDAGRRAEQPGVACDLSGADEELAAAAGDVARAIGPRREGPATGAAGLRGGPRTGARWHRRRLPRPASVAEPAGGAEGASLWAACQCPGTRTVSP